MTTFVLFADTANGVQKVDNMDYVIDNPDADFVPAAEFIDYLKDLGDDETLAALFDDLVHKEIFEAVQAEYGIH